MTTEQKPKTSPLAIMGGIAVLVIGVTIAALSLANPKAPVEAIVTDSSTLERADSWVYGEKTAKATLVEFLDPECESCAAVHPTVRELKSKFAGKLRIVTRYMPLHGTSLLAIAATEAAGEQGKYWEYQDVLFRDQQNWADDHNPNTNPVDPKTKFLEYAKILNLDEAAFAKAMENPKYIQKAERDKQDGLANGVKGTPTFFLDGKLLELNSLNDLENSISAAVQ
jgi:protein-disulfide isomerase